MCIRDSPGGAPLGPVGEGTAPPVIATGGGCVERPANRRLLAARSLCIWLEAPAACLQRRIRAGGATRPPLEGADAAAELPRIAARRAPLYAAVAHLRWDCGEREVETVARELEAELKRSGFV